LVNPPKIKEEDHMSRKKRRHFTPEEKFNIVKQVLSKARTVSEIAEEYGLHPNQYYRWQNEFFESALIGFKEKNQGRTKAAQDREKQRMESEIQRMKDVIAEVVSENIVIKKKNMG
jgi:transposase-like protein